MAGAADMLDAGGDTPFCSPGRPLWSQILGPCFRVWEEKWIPLLKIKFDNHCCKPHMPRPGDGALASLHGGQASSATASITQSECSQRRGSGNDMCLPPRELLSCPLLFSHRPCCSTRRSRRSCGPSPGLSASTFPPECLQRLSAGSC